MAPQDSGRSPVTHDAQAPLGYYRFPALYADTLVFAAEGDLWCVGVEGGVATRLTSHPGEKSHVAIAPDGTTLAFSASYEGPTEVYTMPLQGGLPTRHTWEGVRSVVGGWTPHGQILYATHVYSTLPALQLLTLDPATNQKTPLPLYQAAEGAFTPDEGTLFFTRLGAQSSHTKRYMGGTVQNLWRFHTGETEAVPLTSDYRGTSKSPMVWEDRVYFLTDRDGHMNLWSMDLDGRDLRQHTFHAGWDAATPSLSQGRIAYKLGADLWLYDMHTGVTRPLAIRMPSDFDQLREVWVTKPMDYLTSVALAPHGNRMALTARGQVFVAPTKQGRLVEVTRQPGVRYRQARFMPDGRTILALSDASGEVELWRLPANGVGPSEQLTSGGTKLRWEGVPSPDGKWIAHHDKNMHLWLCEIETKQETTIASSTRGYFRDLRWSPDSKWLAYSVPAANGFYQIALLHLETGESVPITSDRYDSYSATWSRDGAWLYFLSDRHLHTLVPSPWGPRQPDPFIATPTQVYALALHKDARFPFTPADELMPEPLSDTAPQPETPPPLRIELEDIATRLYKVPIPPGNYHALSTDGARLFWVSTDLSFARKKTLQVLAIGPEKPEVKNLLEEITDYHLSDDGKKLLVRKGEMFYSFDAADKAPEKLEQSQVDLSGWRFSFDPREQLRQMFEEAWRLERDYFYDPHMHGLDWPAIREKYRPLAARVTSRSELNDVLAQMISELSALHMFVVGGDLRKSADEVPVASLGAELVPDAELGGYHVARIYRADPDNPDEISPLARPDVRIQEGDVLTAINGVDTLSVPDLAVLLRHQAGKQILCRVHPHALGVARDVIVTPITQEQAGSLRYTDWEVSRRQRVEERGHGRIGYVHLRAMSGGNFAEWARDFYPIFHREGLILDMRNNTGGNIDSWLLGKLLRKAWFYWQPPVGDTTWNMQYAFRGHLVVLVNAHTASDGEACAEGCRRLGLGIIIGTRTWGGEIWLTSSNILVDKGVATAAEFGVFGPEGEWLIEGHGVEPDIVVDNLPHETFQGRDAQLDTAIEYLLKRIEAEPVAVPPPPSYPNKAMPIPESVRGST
jgi:tricorn protease